MAEIEVVNVTKKFPFYEFYHEPHEPTRTTTRYEQIQDGFFFALSDVSLSIEKGECTIIAGANGSGKSLLMSIIAGLEDPSSGSVKTASRPGLVFQEPDSQILGETPREDVAFGPRNMRLSKSEIKARVGSALLET
ncbi:ATP-binding cassette domain-containing protein, partial [Treponema sp. R6D11]